jgi:hypothetical protein
VRPSNAPRKEPKRSRYCAGVRPILRRNRRPKKLVSSYPTCSAIDSIDSPSVSSIYLASSSRSACTYSSGDKPVAFTKRRMKVRSGSPDSFVIALTGDGLA